MLSQLILYYNNCFIIQKKSSYKRYHEFDVGSSTTLETENLNVKLLSKIDLDI